jgi:hypothetical protein
MSGMPCRSGEQAVAAPGALDASPAVDGPSGGGADVLQSMRMAVPICCRSLDAITHWSTTPLAMGIEDVPTRTARARRPCAEVEAEHVASPPSL